MLWEHESQASVSTASSSSPKLSRVFLKLDTNTDNMFSISFSIVIIRNWLGNPANFKGTNKDQKIYVGRSTTLHNLLFCTHTLWPNYVTVTFLLVSSSGTNHDLLCLCRVMAKKANKNIEQRILPSFLTIYLY